MLFIFDTSGNPLKVVPEKVFQGSNKANTVYFAMPLDALIPYEVNVQYRIPSGNVLPTARMVAQGKVEGVTYGDLPVYVWTIDITSTVTAFVGQVTMQFFVQFGEEIIATAAAEFVVSKGVPVKLPTPTADQQTTYNQIITTLSSIENILIDTASSPGFTFAGGGSARFVYVSGYTGTPPTNPKTVLKVAPYTIIDGEYYKVVAYGKPSNTAAIVNYGNVTLPDSLNSLQAKAFNDVNMSEAVLVIPKSVSTIQDSALNFKATSTVTKQRIVFESPSMPTLISDTAFGTNDGVIEIYCTTSAYPDWKNYVDTNYKSGRVVVISDVDTGVLEAELADYQKKVDTALNTTAKTVVGAINENKANIEAANTEIGEKLNSTGGTISGNLAIQGNLTVAGTTTTEHVEQLFVDKPVIVVNGKKTNLQTVLAGLAINKNANATYGILYNPATDTVLFGEGTVDENDMFTFNEGEGLPLAIRADSSAFTDVHLVKWNAAKNIFEDAGVTAANIVTTCNSYTDSKINEALGTIETALAAIDTGTGV